MRRSRSLGACAVVATAIALGSAAAASPLANDDTKAPVVATAAPTRCVVPKILGSRLLSARVLLLVRGCRPGSVVRVGSVLVGRGRVLAQRPVAGRRLRLRARVDMVVSSGTPKH